jgi:hypothetical protein
VIGALPREADLQRVYVERVETLFDGYDCLWFADRQAFEVSAATPEWQTWWADGAQLFGMQTLSELSAVVEEVVIVDGRPGPYKVVWITRFKAELNKDDAHHYWQFTHGPIVREAGIDRYVQSHVVGAVGDLKTAVRPGATVLPRAIVLPDFDGFSECWFANEQGFIDALATPHWKRLHEDRHQIFDMSKMWAAALEERVVVD